jgi:hypothetical protein
MVEKRVIREFITTLANKAVPVGDDDSLLAARLLDSLNIAELFLFTFFVG